MSAKKQKNTSDVRQTFSKLGDVVARIKGCLSEHKESEISPDLYDNLSRGAALAERLFDLRGRADDDWESMAEELDDEGTRMWNTSSLVRQLSQSTELFAMTRLLGFRMVQAGAELKPDGDTTIQLLQLACKAGSALSDAGKHDIASSVLSSAASYEDALRASLMTSISAESGERAEDAEVRKHLQKRGEQAIVLYFASRMEAAFWQGNEGVAGYMLDKFTETDKHLLGSLGPQDLIILARQIAILGKANINKSPEEQPSSQHIQVSPAHEEHKQSEARRALEAARYLQRAYALIELAEAKVEPGDMGVGSIGREGLGLGDLKRAMQRNVLRALTRAYYLSHSLDAENLGRAEATVEELLALLDADPVEGQNEEYQQCRWMRIHLLKRRQADDDTLQSAVVSIIYHMPMNKKSVSEIIVELRTLTSRRQLVTSCSEKLLERALRDDRDAANELAHVAQVLTWIIFSHSRREDWMQGVNDLAAAFDAVQNANVYLPTTPGAACLTLLWQAGERHHAAKRYAPAAAFFQLGAHGCLSALGTANVNKCFRKSAMCHLQAHEYARAAQVVRRGDERCEEAGTCFILFLVAAEQGLEDEASRAIEGIVNGANFDVRMLRLAIQKAREKRFRGTLLVGLEALLGVIRRRRVMRGAESEGVEALTLARSVIRLAKELLEQPGSNRPVLVQSLLKYFDVAKELVEATFAEKKESAIAKDIDWLWRAAYNLGVLGCAEWQDAVEDASRFFDYARQMLEFCVKASVVDAEEDVYVHMLYSEYAALTGRVFAHQGKEATQPRDEAQIRVLLTETQSCRKTIESIYAQGKITRTEVAQRVSAFRKTLQIWTSGFCALLKDWDGALATIADATRPTDNRDAGDAFAVLEAIADTLWTAEGCPHSVLFAALEAILHASLDIGALSVEKFARWLRAVCTMLVARDSEADRAKALEYIEQAVAVMDEHKAEGPQVYPVDERQWLLATTFNTGIETFNAGFIPEAKRWLECATQICRFVPYGEARAEKVSKAYSAILAKHTDER